MPINPNLLYAMVEATAKTRYEYACMAVGKDFCWDSLGKVEKQEWFWGVKPEILAAIRVAEAWPTPHKLVGREATGAMIMAGNNEVSRYSTWRAMFDAAPGMGE